MSNDILNNSYVVGIGGRNLVLNTLGRVYIKNQDRYYELEFKNNLVTDFSEELPDIIITDDVQNLEYPGDNKLIIDPNGLLYYTENGQIFEFQISSESISFDLKDLVVNGTITINTDEDTPPLYINSTKLVENLNVQYLNGFQDKDFAKKVIAETIFGAWTFLNKITFSNQKVTGVISNENEFDATTLDFKDSILTIDYINVRKGINFPDGDTESSVIDSVEGELWIGDKYQIESYMEMSDWEGSPLTAIDYAYTTEYLDKLYDTGDEDLDDYNSLNVWYNVYLTNWYTDADDDPLWTPQIRDLTKQNEIDYVNTTYLNSFNLDVRNKLFVYYDMYIADPEYNGVVLQIKIKKPVEYGLIFNNSKVKDKDNLIVGNICEHDEENIYVRLNTDESVLLNDDSTLIIMTNSYHKGGVVLNSMDNHEPFIDVIVDYKYHWEPIDEDVDNDRLIRLSDNNNILSRFGNLSGLADDSSFGHMQHIGLFLQGVSQSTLDLLIDDVTKENILDYVKENQSQIFIKNPNVSFNEITIFNPDGSGFISDGRIRWTKDVLVIDDVDMSNSRLDNVDVTNSRINGTTIKESTIDQQTFNDSNLQAGGDLEGTYPNPTVKDLQEILNRLDQLELALSNINSTLSDIQDGLQSLDERVTALENA